MSQEHLEVTEDMVLKRRCKPDHMTGQEFYERFEKELKGAVFTFTGGSGGMGEFWVKEAVYQCQKAAKKAAGL